MRKTVLLPIEVPDNDYCWDYTTPCTYFSNEGGYPVCDLRIGWDLKFSDNGVKKPEACMELVEIFPLFKKLQKFNRSKEK